MPAPAATDSCVLEVAAAAQATRGIDSSASQCSPLFFVALWGLTCHCCDAHGQHNQSSGTQRRSFTQLGWTMKHLSRRDWGKKSFTPELLLV